MALASVPRARLQATLAAGAAVVLAWRVHGPVTAAIAVSTAALAVLAWSLPAGYAPVQRTIDRLTHALLAVVSWSALALVYFGVFAPWRAWRRLTGRDPLATRPDPRAATYLVALPPGATGRFDRQF